MHHRFILLICMLLALIFSKTALANSLIIHRYQQVENAFASCDIDTLSQLAKSEDDGSKTIDALYLAAFTQYRLAAALIQQDNIPPAKKAIALGIKQLEKALKQQSNFEEAQILLAAIYGLRFIVQPYRAIFQGTRASALINEGLAKAPRNPRGLMIKGVAKLQTPRLLGGNRQHAKKLLEQGLHRFKSGDTSGSPINWGKVDIYLWLGRIAASENNASLALSYYREALLHSPDNCWVKQAMAKRGFPLAD